MDYQPPVVTPPALLSPHLGAEGIPHVESHLHNKTTSLKKPLRSTLSRRQPDRVTKRATSLSNRRVATGRSRSASDPTLVTTVGGQRPPSRLAVVSSMDATMAEAAPRKLTPVTKRVSNAKKGQYVHWCKHPGCPKANKPFSRAEHLRRHELNHNREPKFPCNVGNCRRPFRRRDLLLRHMERGDAQHHSAWEVLIRNEASQVQDAFAGDPSFSLNDFQPSLVAAFSSASDDFQAMLAAVTSAPNSSYASSMTEPMTPGHRRTSQNLTSTLLQPLSVPSQPLPASSAFVPELFYGPSDDSTLFSTVDSLLSPNFALAAGRDRATSLPLGIQTLFQAAKSPPASEDSRIHASWAIDPAGSAPHEMTNSYGEEPFLASMLLPSFDVPSERPPSLATPLRLALAALKEIDWLELRNLLGGPDADNSPLTSSLVDKLDEYISLYWQHCDRYMPIVHHHTFFERQISPILLVSMAILGAHSGDCEARNFALGAHKRAKAFMEKRSPMSADFGLREMQATILLELFGIFRARRVNVTPSPEFKLMYKKLLNVYRQRPLKRAEVNDRPTEWFRWIDGETERRLLLAAFYLDALQGVFFEQKLVNEVTSQDELPLPCPSSLWQTASATQWVLTNPIESSDRPMFLKDAASMASSTLEHQSNTSLFSSLLIAAYRSIKASQDPAASLGAASAGIPEVTIFTHAQAVFKLVPLRALLAVVGPTWCLGRKLSEVDFQAAKDSMRSWGSNRTRSLRATWHAAHVLRAAVGEVKGNSGGLHEKWCVYVSALVCWAYVCANQPDVDEYVPAPPQAEQEFRNFLAVLDVPSWKDIRTIPRRWQALALLRQVRAEISGTDCGLIDEAVGVLGKMGEGRLGEYF